MFLDTNVLIQAPDAIYRFKENDLVIPLMVLEELDGLKKAEGEKGLNARASIRELESLRQTGDLLTGVQLKDGGRLRIESTVSMWICRRNCRIQRQIIAFSGFVKLFAIAERM